MASVVLEPMSPSTPVPLVSLRQSVRFPQDERLWKRLYNKCLMHMRMPFVIDLFSDYVVLRSFVVAFFMCIGAKVVLWLVLGYSNHGLSREYTLIMVLALSPFFITSGPGLNRILRLLLSLSLMAGIVIDLHYNFRPIWISLEEIEYTPEVNTTNTTSLDADDTPYFQSFEDSAYFYTAEKAKIPVSGRIRLERALNVLAYPIVEVFFLTVLLFYVLIELPFCRKYMKHFQFSVHRWKAYEEYVSQQLLKSQTRVALGTTAVDISHIILSDVTVTAEQPVSTMPLRRRIAESIKRRFRKEKKYIATLWRTKDAFFYSQRMLIALWVSALELTIGCLAFVKTVYDFRDLQDFVNEIIKYFCGTDDDCSDRRIRINQTVFDVVLATFPMSCVMAVFVHYILLWRTAVLYRKRILRLRRGLRFWDETEFAGLRLMPATSYIGSLVIRVLFGFFLLAFIFFVILLFFGWFIWWKDFRDFIWSNLGAFLISVAGIAIIVKIALRIFVSSMLFTDKGRTVKHRRIYSLFELLLVYASLVVGLVTAVKQFLLHVVYVFLYFSRLDHNLFRVSADEGFTSYCSMVWIDHLFMNPVVYTFCNMIDRGIKKKRAAALEIARNAKTDGVPMDVIYHDRKGRLVSFQTDYRKSVARFRWFLAWTLMHNQSLIEMRCQAPQDSNTGKINFLSPLSDPSTLPKADQVDSADPPDSLLRVPERKYTVPSVNTIDGNPMAMHPSPSWPLRSHGNTTSPGPSPSSSSSTHRSSLRPSEQIVYRNPLSSFNPK